MCRVELSLWFFFFFICRIFAYCLSLLVLPYYVVNKDEYIALCWQWSASNSKTEAKFRTFWAPEKLWVEWEKCVEEHRPKTNHLCSQCMFYISDVLPCFETTALPMRLRSKMEAIFRTFDHCKIMGGVCKMTASFFRARPRTQPLICFWRGAPIGRLGD